MFSIAIIFFDLLLYNMHLFLLKEEIYSLLIIESKTKIYIYIYLFIAYNIQNIWYISYCSKGQDKIYISTAKNGIILPS